MVARISLGRNILGLLHYNEEKVRQGKAKVLSAAGFGAGGTGAPIKEKHRRFKYFTDRNKRAKLNAFHVSLNFSPKDKLDDDQMRYIAQSYMEQVGFGGQPCLVYRHDDAAHPHVHIVSTNITREGKRIETHNLGKDKSEKARKQLEKELGLVKAERQQGQRLPMEPLAPIEYGKKETKAAMSNVITEVMRSYAYTSLGEFSAVLGQFNVGLIQGEEGSSMKENNGLAYAVLDSKGRRLGVPIKASALYARPTMERLQKRMERNQRTKLKGMAAMRVGVENALQHSAGKGMEHFQQELTKKGLAAQFHYSSAGEVFGLTIIDHVNRTVCKASELSRIWSGKKTAQHLGEKVLDLEMQVRPVPSKATAQESIPRQGENEKRRQGAVWKSEKSPVLSGILSVVQAMVRPESQEMAMPLDQKKKKKKRRKLS
ncbi:relaxase/mobilization nuclease [Echinicola strongylocentroti]|uniref:Relaxase/mobilization nuclease n=1 Tax=Echinicola strongylocentroti TaxID=1795355 RepID=A0A2Z4IF08_9BACT|nr:relaxase/mobilization nuclease domain-containing protein [Echinicola strongylocentroti]AWW29455.1 relaxase/mobilization nuclease [Echinicola strongylocentroti]